MSDHKNLLAIKRAVKANQAEVVRHLLTETPHLVVARGHGWTPFQDAAFQAKSEIVRVMLEQGAGITAADIAHALHHAVQLPHTESEVVEVLVATGQVPEVSVAIYRNDVETFAALLSARPEVIQSRDSGLLASIESCGKWSRGNGQAPAGSRS